VVLGPEPDPRRGIFSVHLHSEGRYAEKLMVEAPSSKVSPRVTEDMLEDPGSRLWPRMEGRYVFKHAVTRFPEVIQEALAANGHTIADLDLLIPHQANLRISQMVAMGSTCRRRRSSTTSSGTGTRRPPRSRSRSTRRSSRAA
jgi:3-oxoacyl-[acyl-carrier-protein] synthase-3